MPPSTSVAPFRNRIVGSGVEAPDQLLANPRNWRLHPKEQQEALEGVLDTVGWAQEVVVNRTTGHIVDGHLRVMIALRREEPAIPAWLGDRKQSTAWEFPRPKRSTEHPTMKPVALLERALRNSTPNGGMVLDCFAGSGSTLIAAQATGRRCFAMELDGRYVDVILARFERITGHSPKQILGDSV